MSPDARPAAAPADALADALADCAAGPGGVAIAVSGGVDSLTLACAAHAALGPSRVRAYHASSPAVPGDATARTRALAEARGWSLTVLDAGEFADPRYLSNPVDRCFFCKTDLYGAIARRLAPGTTLLSGTNTDDLGEYRPGLEAARRAGVRHPFVEAGIDKRGVRALALGFGLPEVAALPASPCLSSRIETGIAIDPDTLAMVDAVERAVRATLGGGGTVRCRIRASGLFVELDPAGLGRLAEGGVEAALSARLESLAGRTPRFAPYRNGGAFLRRVAS